MDFLCRRSPASYGAGRAGRLARAYDNACYRRRARRAPARSDPVARTAPPAGGPPLGEHHRGILTRDADRERAMRYSFVKSYFEKPLLADHLRIMTELLAG